MKNIDLRGTEFYFEFDFDYATIMGLIHIF